jgi:hypothetical protein
MDIAASRPTNIGCNHATQRQQLPATPPLQRIDDINGAEIGITILSYRQQ